MKNKIVVIVLTIAFIGIMLLLSNVLKIKTNKINTQDNITDEGEKVMIINVTRENFKTEVLNSEKTVLIDFYAEWCGPCKMLSRVVEQFASENENIKVVKINVDDEQDLAIQYGVMSIPTLVVIKKGQEVNRSVGLVSIDDILNLVK